MRCAARVRFHTPLRRAPVLVLGCALLEELLESSLARRLGDGRTCCGRLRAAKGWWAARVVKCSLLQGACCASASALRIAVHML
jgi:hypothetical protein